MQTTTSSSILDQIRQGNDAFEAAFSQQDVTALAALYTDDAMLLPPGGNEQQGPQTIGQFWQGAMNMGVANAQLTTVEAEQHGDTAIEIGHYRLSTSNGDLIDHGKYVVIWKQQGDQWFLHRDIWNTSQAAS